MARTNLTIEQGATFDQSFLVALGSDSSTAPASFADAVFTARRYVDAETPALSVGMYDSESTDKSYVTIGGTMSAVQIGLHLDPEETAELDHKNYVYDIKLTTSGGDAYFPERGEINCILAVSRD